MEQKKTALPFIRERIDGIDTNILHQLGHIAVLPEIANPLKFFEHDNFIKADQPKAIKVESLVRRRLVLTDRVAATKYNEVVGRLKIEQREARRQKIAYSFESNKGIIQIKHVDREKAVLDRLVGVATDENLEIEESYIRTFWGEIFDLSCTRQARQLDLSRSADLKKPRIANIAAQVKIFVGDREEYAFSD